MPASDVADAISSCSSAMRPQIGAVPVAVDAVVGQARDLDLVHAVDHGAGAAGLAELHDQFGDGGCGQSLSTQFDRHGHAEQALAPQGIHGLVGEAAVAVDRIGGGGRDFGNACHAGGARSRAPVDARGANLSTTFMASRRFAGEV